MTDIFDGIGRCLILFATWLDKRTLLPWPLLIAAFFPILAVTLRTTLWVARGTTWPVQCKYFHTQQARTDKPCRSPVAGEWYYCRAHNRDIVYGDGHRVEPKLERWMALQPAVDRQNRGRRKVERHDIRGVGFVMLFSNRETLLFYKGLAKRPREVLPGLRTIPGDFRRRFQDLRRLPLREALGFRQADGENLPLGVAAHMDRVVTATRWVLGSILIGLLFILLSVLLSGGWQTIAEFVASTAFITGWSLFRYGIWKEEDSDWIREGLREGIKASAVLIFFGFTSGLIGATTQSLRDSDTTAAALFQLTSFVAV